ncbi:hypothetical protein ACERIT_13050 [Halopenitus sp. H-Gu1]|uniref:hypothetical protein n=1 Tax=Halopenitus sp. H-Gu1 TaxID=3242697 RepID=UPI00359CDE03
MPKSSNPLRRIGVYKTLDQVPDHSRLYNYAATYESRDVWAEYVDQELSGAAETVQYETELVETSWKDHMRQRGRHPALARPDDVELWFAELTDRMQTKRAYNPYWVRLEDFYTYLLWHTEHPHSYHPPRMAAGKDGATSRVWEFKIGERSI